MARKKVDTSDSTAVAHAAEIAAKAFAEHPYLTKVWVGADGHYHLHPKAGCELVEKD